MKTGPLTLIAAAAALAVTAGIATLTVPGDEDDAGKAAPAAERIAVERSTLLCPQPGDTEVGETTYTSFVPGGEGDEGSAELLPATTESEAAEQQEKKDDDGKGDESKGDGQKKDDAPDPVAPLKRAGTPAEATTDEAEAPALVGTAHGDFAPGWSVQQTTLVTAGDGRGLSGARCTAPDSEFWFAGASTIDERRDYVQLTNPDDEAAVVDLQVFDKDGPVESEAGNGIQVPARSSVSVLLSTVAEEPSINVAVHVAVRSGRVGAAVHAADEQVGGDWLQPVSEPAPGAVLPGIPGDATSVRLVVYVPGEDDADLAVKLAGPNGSITPAGYESVHAKSGMTTAIDMQNLTKGEVGSLILEPEDGSRTPIVAALRVTRGKNTEQEMAFIPSATPVEERTTASGNWPKAASLSLTAPDKAVEVKVTASPGSEGGEPAEETYTVKPRTTLTVEPPKTSGTKGTFALTVERVSGGELYASRTLETKESGIPMFTIQTLPDDKGMVEVPDAEQDLGVLTD
ncbi:hypothetical protein AA958_11375 [Streptomyces sp. CNQ-509]|uniref:DUF5719 family protein n=1 Tax=unclassified Streptomyces TaxID=2593676 RepID=UPI00062E005C|nr:DUF5719 family protein [Streptomyces sp. CNQ-509]AKH82730.1 hypothetical protein AA958_11375 [Streptomyces sp. CNQ-509]